MGYTFGYVLPPWGASISFPISKILANKTYPVLVR